MIEDILVVDDEPLMRKFLEETLRRRDKSVDLAKDGAEAIEKIKKKNYDLVFSDLKLPKADGIEVLRNVKEKDKSTAVIMMTAYGTVETAVEAMKLGAMDYLLKPFSPEQAEMMLDRIEEINNLIAENRYLREEVNREYDFKEIIGNNTVMQDTFDMIKKVAPTKATVLIQGESGTGKELIARAIHFNSDRINKPFVKLNCAALPEGLLESELFGHEKGSFTGAHTKRQGRFELADGGTLFLDEISEIAPALQAKLLRVLQEREFERVGGTKSLKVDVRIIATTNRNLNKAIADGEFREDLYYRLNVVPIALPPLRERKDDIPLLVEHFLKKYIEENNMEPFAIDPKTIDLMKNYSWPGNVREFENIMERMVVMNFGKVVKPSHIASWINADYAETASPAATGTATGCTLEEMEKNLILNTLAECDGNRTKAADVLQISIRTLRNKLNVYKEQGIEV